MAELMRSVRITLPENCWRGIIEFGIPEGEDLHSSLDLIFRAFMPEKYQSIIGDHRNGLLQDAFAYLKWLESREVFLLSSFVEELSQKLSIDAPDLTVDQALSYLLIKRLEEGIAEIEKKKQARKRAKVISKHR